MKNLQRVFQRGRDNLLRLYFGKVILTPKQSACRRQGDQRGGCCSISWETGVDTGGGAKGGEKFRRANGQDWGISHCPETGREEMPQGCSVFTTALGWLPLAAALRSPMH